MGSGDGLFQQETSTKNDDADGRGQRDTERGDDDSQHDHGPQPFPPSDVGLLADDRSWSLAADEPDCSH